MYIVHVIYLLIHEWKRKGSCSVPTMSRDLGRDSRRFVSVRSRS